MSDTVKIRYIGPHTEGVGTDYLAQFDAEFVFARGEAVEVPAALAAELLERREPVPPGVPVQDPTTGECKVELAPVFELADGHKASKETAR